MFRSGEVPCCSSALHGMLIADYGRHQLLPEAQYADFKRPDPFIADSIGHHREWTEACKTGGPTTCNFDYSGALTEAALLCNVALRAGKKMTWDAANGWSRPTLRRRPASFVAPTATAGASSALSQLKVGVPGVERSEPPAAKSWGRAIARPQPPNP